MACTPGRALALPLLLLAGCGGALEGSWSGTADCGADGSYPVTLPLKRGADGDEGVGVVDELSYFSQPATYSFAAVAVAEDDDTVDLTLSDCQFEAQGQAWEATCGDPGPLAWDGEDRLEGELPIASLSCALLLERG